MLASSFEHVATERLRLDRTGPDDVGDLYPITSDPATWEHAPDGRHRDPATTLDWLERSAARWERDGLSYWIARLAGGPAVGVGGVQRQSTGHWNLFYRFAPAAWGHGYAQELGRAAIDAARAEDSEAAVIAWILEGHERSQRVATRLGLVSRGLHLDPSDGVARLAFTDRDVALGPSVASSP